MLTVFGMNYKKASVALREKMAIQKADASSKLTAFKGIPGVRECVLLSTCNRFELYLVLESLDDIRGVHKLMKHDFAVSDHDIRTHFYFHESERTVEHLFEVVSSLDSMVVGESQILGQVRQAYSLAVENKCTSVVLNKLFHHAIRVGKRVRTETEIGRNFVSVSSVAVDLARKVLGDLADRSVLLIGAGEMAELAVDCLIAKGARKLTVTSRTYERARGLADRYGAESAEMHRIYEKIAHADVVISSTDAPHHVIEYKGALEAMEKRGGRPVVFIDIAVPRDVDPRIAGIEGAHLYNIDDLKEVIEGNMKLRSNETRAIRKIINAEATDFMHWLSRQSVAPFVARFRRHMEEIITSEIDKFSRRMPDSEIMKKSIAAFTEAVINRVTSLPIMKIQKCGKKCHVESCIRNVACLFNLDGDFDEESDEPRAKCGNGEVCSREGCPRHQRSEAGDTHERCSREPARHGG